MVKYVLRFRLRFSDTWRPQIETIQSFFEAQGIATTSISHEKNEGKRDAYRIDVGAIASVLAAAKAMLPHCSKKAEDLRIAIDYLEGRITGNQAVARFNEEVWIGRRSGQFRETDLPCTRGVGVRLAQLENARNARAAYAVDVSAKIQRQIRKDHLVLKLGQIRLSRKYGYSVSVIRRVLGAP